MAVPRRQQQADATCRGALAHGGMTQHQARPHGRECGAHAEREPHGVMALQRKRTEDQTPEELPDRRAEEHCTHRKLYREGIGKARAGRRDGSEEREREHEPVHGQRERPDRRGDPLARPSRFNGSDDAASEVRTPDDDRRRDRRDQQPLRANSGTRPGGREHHRRRRADIDGRQPHEGYERHQRDSEPTGRRGQRGQVGSAGDAPGRNARAYRIPDGEPRSDLAPVVRPTQSHQVGRDRRDTDHIRGERPQVMPRHEVLEPGKESRTDEHVVREGAVGREGVRPRREGEHRHGKTAGNERQERDHRPPWACVASRSNSRSAARLGCTARAASACRRASAAAPRCRRRCPRRSRTSANPGSTARACA